MKIWVSSHWRRGKWVPGYWRETSSKSKKAKRKRLILSGKTLEFDFCTVREEEE